MDLALVLQAVFLVIALLCPISLVALAAWAAWSRRRARTDHPDVTEPRSAVDESEIARMRRATGAQDTQPAKR